MGSSLIRKPLTMSPGNQPYGRSSLDEYAFEVISAFYIDMESRQALERSGLQDNEIDELLHWGMTRYVVTSLREQHAEGYYVSNPVADTYAMYTTGAMPIQISMDGFLYSTKDQDHRMEFLIYYLSCMRGTDLTREKLIIVFLLKNTMMRLRIQSINLNQTSQIQDFAQMGITGVGFSYGINTEMSG